MGIWVTSALARYLIEDSSISSACFVLEGVGAVLTWVVTSIRMLAGQRLLVEGFYPLVAVLRILFMY
jgi:hypothetical protein